MSKDKQDHIADANKKVSSVDWLINFITEDHMYKAKSLKQWLEAFEQAKAMHKEEIEDAELRGKEIIIIKHTEHSTPIELPSDEEIKEYINSTPYYGHCTQEYCEGIEDGIKWVINKIQGGNNESN